MKILFLWVLLVGALVAGEPTRSMVLKPSSQNMELVSSEILSFHSTLVGGYREPGFWERYHWPIIGVSLFGLLQASLIVGLLVNRNRRIRAEAEATLIADISAKFVNLPASEVDQEIMNAERRICELLDLDVAGLWQWTNDAEPSLKLTHLHGKVKVPPPDNMKAAEFFPWFQESLAAKRVVGFSSLDKIPDEAVRDRESFRAFGICSCLTLPLSVGGEPPIGALGLNTTRKEHAWSEAQIARLQMIAQIFTNALARKRADQALRESELRLSLAADAAGAGLWVLDWDQQVFWITERARAIFGYSPDVVLHMAQFEQSVHPLDLDRIHKGIAHSVTTGDPLNVEYRIRRNDGETRWIASNGRPFFKANGDPERLLGLSMDITEQRHAEIEALELRTSLAHSGRVTLLGQLASALAHELSQPLGAILRNAEAAEIMLQDASPDIEEMRAIIDDILRDDHRAGDMINKLRSLLKKGRLDVQPLDLTEVIDGVLSLVQPDAISRQVHISRALSANLPLVGGDKIHLQQVLINLLVNAMDVLASRKDGRRAISIHARATGGSEVEIRVCDNGTGISDGHFERLFEPFFTTKATGMGMGLPVSKTIIEAHKGKLWAENRPEGGACFCFTVPIVRRPS